MPTQREVIRFDTEPVKVKLDKGPYAGIECHGQYGIDWRYSVDNGKAVMYLPEEARDALVQCGVAAGEVVEGEKLRLGDRRRQRGPGNVCCDRRTRCGWRSSFRRPAMARGGRRFRCDDSLDHRDFCGLAQRVLLRRSRLRDGSPGNSRLCNSSFGRLHGLPRSRLRNGRLRRRFLLRRRFCRFHLYGLFGRRFVQRLCPSSKARVLSR